VDQGREILAQGRRRFFQYLLHHWVRTPGVEHTDRLGALSRKNKYKWLHEKSMRKIQKNNVVSNKSLFAKHRQTLKPVDDKQNNMKGITWPQVL
jgi:hypothetical protein